MISFSDIFIHTACNWIFSRRTHQILMALLKSVRSTQTMEEWLEAYEVFWRLTAWCMFTEMSNILWSNRSNWSIVQGTYQAQEGMEQNGTIRLLPLLRGKGKKVQDCDSKDKVSGFCTPMSTVCSKKVENHRRKRPPWPYPDPWKTNFLATLLGRLYQFPTPLTTRAIASIINEPISVPFWFLQELEKRENISLCAGVPITCLVSYSDEYQETVFGTRSARTVVLITSDVDELTQFRKRDPIFNTQLLKHTSVFCSNLHVNVSTNVSAAAKMLGVCKSV